MLTIPIDKIELHEILHIIGKNSLRWQIFDLWATTVDPSEFNIFDIEKMSKSESGHEISWDKLNKLASVLSQMIEGTITAKKGPPFKPQGGLKPCDYPQFCEITITAFDSTQWEISTWDNSISEKILAELRSRSHQI